MHRNLRMLIGITALVAAGCAGPAKLAEKSEGKLAEGDVWKAWQLATKALDKAPANARARQAAAAAASTIAQDWQRRIVATAETDSMGAAEEALKFAAFRHDAIPYTTVRVSETWVGEETTLRRGAAQHHYDAGVAAAQTHRPKKAYAQFREASRFAPDFRDASARADAAFEQAVTHVAVVPLQSGSDARGMGRDVAAAWTGALVEHLDEPFTRILPTEDVENRLRVSELGRASRSDAIRIGARAGADRVVWGSIGPIDSRTSVQVFRRTVWRRVQGVWVEVPLEVIARTRTTRVSLAYEVIATPSGTTLARESGPRTVEARAVWTSYVPEGDVDSYALVTDEFRAADPDRARQIEAEWRNAVGAGTTLAEVLSARRACVAHPTDRNAALARYAAGAAFVMLQDLPAPEELAEAALTSSWPSVRDALARLDAVDDADLGALSNSDTP